MNQRARVDVSLEVGRLEETTTVVASTPLLRTDSSEVGTVIEERAIKELPLNGRNFATLVYLTPGITPGQAGENLSGASTFNPRGASNFNALGHQANANAWLIDGIDNNEYSFNTVIIAPSVEQVREFKVLSGVFSAEFGRGAGVVSVATKSGTNTLHGTVFEYLRDDAFDARNFFVRKVPLPTGGLQKDPKPPLNRHQFGGALGGALVIPGIYDGHSRTFFFTDYAGLKEKRGQVFVNTVPTALTRIGDFSDFRDTSGNPILIYDPLTTQPNPDFDSTKPVSATNPQFLRDPFPATSFRPIGSMWWAETSRASTRSRTVRGTSTTTPRRSIVTSPTTCSPDASIIADRTRIPSSCGSTGASSSSTRRRARPRVVCQRHQKRRPSSISVRSWPAYRTRA